MKNLEIVIEPADLSDGPAILDLQKLAYQSEAALYDDYTIAPLTQPIKGMNDDFQRQAIFKATLDTRIVGSVRGYLRNGTCYIGRLIVDPGLQNRGIGTRLMQSVERHFSNAGRYELFTGHKSERNLYLYGKLGYRVVRKEIVTEKLTHVFLEKLKQ